MAGGAPSVGARLEYAAATKKNARNLAAFILEATPAGQSLHGQAVEFVLGLLLQHPRVIDKLAACLDVLVDSDPRYGRKCFWLRSRDNGLVDFSYRQCLSPPTSHARFVAACRNEIEADIIAFKQAAFTKGSICPMTGVLLQWHNTDVDHSPPHTFAVLVDRYIDWYDVDLEAVRYRDRGIGNLFSDRRLAASWREFHNRNASLRLLSAQANRSGAA